MLVCLHDNSRFWDPPHPYIYPYFYSVPLSPQIQGHLTVSVLFFWKIITCVLSKKYVDNIPSFRLPGNKFSMTASYILIQNIKECALFKGHVYHASKKLRGKELERGTILQKDPNDKTRFVVADRNEVFFDRSCVEGLDDKLELLPDALAEALLEIISLEERLRFFNRETRQVSHFPLTPGEHSEVEGQNLGLSGNMKSVKNWKMN